MALFADLAEHMKVFSSLPGDITGDNFLFCKKWLTGGSRFPFWRLVYAQLSFGAATEILSVKLDFSGRWMGCGIIFCHIYATRLDILIQFFFLHY